MDAIEVRRVVGFRLMHTGCFHALMLPHRRSQDSRSEPAAQTGSDQEEGGALAR